MELLGDVGQVEGRFSPYGHGVNHGATKVQVWEIVHRLQKIILDTLDGTPFDMGQIEAHISPFVDSVNLDAR
jgi:hypothetical protein